MNRGDFVTIAMQGDFDKPRPALVIQSDQFSKNTTVTVLLAKPSFRRAICRRFWLENGRLALR
ncbi:MAG: type II toxin-antitoxin system PemK/MazF family toxin [Thiobacillaceae bacterium]